MPTVYNAALSTGGRDTLDLATLQRKVQVKDIINLLEPDKAPLVVLLNRLRTEKGGPEYNWLEDVLLPRTVLTSSGASAAALTINVTAGEGSYFKAGDLIKVIRTGEVVRITAIAANTLTTVASPNGRGFAGTAAAINSGDELACVGYAAPENAGAPSLVQTQVASVKNYTQIFRTPFGGSRTLESSPLYGGSDRAYLRKKMLIEHMIDMEKSLLFGLAKENTTATSGRPTRSSGGLENFITTNITSLDSSGLDSVADIENFLLNGFRYGSDTKMLYASPLVIQKINELALADITVYPKEQVYGLNIRKWESSHGTVNIIKSKVLEGPQTKGMAFLLDMENLGRMCLDDTFLRTNIQGNDVDGWADEYVTECGWMVMQEKTHAILKNADGGSF